MTLRLVSSPKCPMCNLQVPTGGLETVTRFAWASAVFNLVMIKSIWHRTDLLVGSLIELGGFGRAAPCV